VAKAHPFLVNVATVRRSPGVRRFERRHAGINGLQITGSEVPPGAEVDVDIVLEAVDGGIVAIGTVTAPWVGECRRCLGTVRGRLDVPVRELYEPRPEGYEASDSVAWEEETYPLHGDQLDLFPLAKDAILLNLPAVPLCREDCAGLCPTCGADRNDGPCGCLQDVGASRWAALDALRSPDLS
jgi:uncharacterized protein